MTDSLMTVRLSLLPLAGLLAALIASTLTAQERPASGEAGDDGPSLPIGVAVAVGVSDPPVIDGRLDDAAWARAAPMTGFTQREPRDGQPASERTEVRVVFDDEALYVGVWAFDSRPTEIVPGERIRDYQVEQSDNVILIFDTYKDEQNGFVFGTTPAGIEYDGQVANQGQGGGRFGGGGGGGGGGQRRFQSGAGGGFNKNWDGSWTVAVSLDGEGWYAEFRIPFNTLRYGSDSPSWGFNVARRIRRLNEESFWSPVPREFNLYRLNYAGDLEGLTPPFRRLATVTPYALTSTARDYEEGETSFDEEAEFGGEAKIQVTQGLTFDATVNTDFAQVEVDNQQVNLTRFSLLFPEKRPFFLENAGFFTVGASGADLFFSRNIGIADGLQVPIKAGGRLSGKAAGFNVGLLHIQTDGLEGVNAYSVARIARELPNRSRVGVLFIDRNGEAAGDYNRTYAADARVAIGEPVTLSSFVARTQTPGLSGNEHAYDATASWASRSWDGSVAIREIGENFNAEVGFVPRDGYRSYSGRVQRYIRPDGFLREIRPHMSFNTFRSRRTGVEKGFEESSRLHLDTHWEWPDGMVVFTTANWVREGLYEPFEISGTDVVVPPGTYDGWEAQFALNTNRSADISFNGRFTAGSFLSGDRWSPSVGVTLRSGAAFSTSVSLDYNDVNLPEGDFETTLVSVNLGYFFTPRIYLQSLIQYSDQIDRLSANVRFGWLNTAGTGLFIVYNEIQGIDELDGPLGRSLTLKYTRQLNVHGG